MFEAKVCVAVPLAHPVLTVHEPLAQKGVDPLQGAPLSAHCPQESHISGWLPEHCKAPGEQTGDAAHEHTPHVHVPL
jgi:hypothetical protein